MKLHFNWVLIRDSVVLDGIFEDYDEAFDTMRYNMSSYYGTWKVICMTDQDLKKWMRGLISIFDCMEKARGYGNLSARHL